MVNPRDTAGNVEEEEVCVCVSVCLGEGEAGMGVSECGFMSFIDEGMPLWYISH